ncbi:MAG: DNA polymerase I [Armatimonadota bacterium]
MDKPKFIVVDGNSLLYRAFFAVQGLATTEGQPTNALYGFTNMLLHVLKEHKPDAVLVAFDARGPTFRHEAYADYKAHRPSTPEDLVRQAPLARELVRTLGIPAVEIPGFEADDCVGTMAVRAKQDGYSVVIVTGDLDELQLVGEDISVLTTRRGVTDTVLYNASAVEERFGLRPEQMVDFKALKGDPSDNVPGVRGIGEKTAVRLLQEFGSLENLLSHLDEVKEKRVRELLEAGREDALRSKELCTIRTDVPCDISPADCRLQPPSREAVTELFTRLEFRSFLNRIDEICPQLSSQQPTVLQEPAPKPVVLADQGQASGAVETLAKCERLSLAACFSSQDPLKGQVECIVACGGPQYCYFVPGGLIRHVLSPLLEAKRHIAVHDLKRYLHALHNTAAHIHLDAWLDTMVAAYLLNPGRSGYDLPDVCLNLLNRQLPSAEPNQGGLLGMADAAANPTVLAAQAAAVLQLSQELEQRLKSDGLWNLYRDVEHPLIRILAEMERAGVLVDRETLASVSISLAHRIRDLELRIYQLAGEEFNIGSTKQLQAILFEKLKLPSGRKTKTGYSTDNEVLAGLAAEHEIAALILEYRELTKLKSTYADALANLIDPSTGRIHTSLNQTATATGRLSSSNPNLQNIPIRTDVGREIRRAFVAGQGNLLVSADYSQIELRVLAHVTREPELLRAFEADEDIHAHTAATVFGVSDQDVTPEMRRRAKAVNFAVLYGMTDYGLSRELGIPVSAAREFINSYFTRFPKVKEYISAVQEDARQKGYVCTLLGRRRYIPEIKSSNRNTRSFAERAAVNSPIQGTAADIMKLAMIRVDKRLRGDNGLARLLLQVHDELLFEAPSEEAPALCEAVRDEMSRAFPLDVPLKVDVKRGPNWSDME